MKGAIIIPTFYKRRHEKGVQSQRGKFLFSRMVKQYKFPIVYTDAPNLDGLDVAIIYAVPYHNRPGIPPGLLDSKVKLIGYFEDLHCWASEECQKNKDILFDRFDVIIGAGIEAFKKGYPQYVSKYIHFPYFFFPYEKYAKLQILPNPIMKCLMLGSINRYYPLREHIKNHKTSQLEIMLPRVPFKKYPELLNKYYCAIATGGSYRDDIRLQGVEDAPVSKYFEIPAAGVLMLAEELSELGVMGLEAGVHYVPITKANVFSQIRNVLSDPEGYMEMRVKAMAIVRKRHSDLNRVEQFQEILGRL